MYNLTCMNVMRNNEKIAPRMCSKHFTWKSNGEQCCDITSKLLIYRITFDFITWWVCEHSHVFENVNKNRRALYLLF